MLEKLLSSGAFLGVCCAFYTWLAVYCGLLVSIYTGNWILSWLTVVTMVCPFAAVFYYVVSRHNRRLLESMMKPMTVSSEKQEQALKDYIEEIEKKE